MRGMSLWQPWASLVAIGAKKIETRSWGTNYRGPLAICSTKRFPLEAVQLCADEPFRTALQPAHEDTRLYSERRFAVQGPDLPLGAVLAVATLADCVRIAAPDEAGYVDARRAYKRFATGNEVAFGDYTVGRYMWMLADVQRLRTPLPVVGAQGLWPVADEVAQQIAEALAATATLDDFDEGPEVAR